MNFFPKKLCLVVASAALVLSGCTKKPERPHPGSTVMGQQPGGPGFDSAPRDTTFDPNTPAIPGRDPWLGGHNREILQAQAVYFDFDKSDIKPSEREKLKVAKEYLDKNPTHKLLLEGHCDWRGTAEYNLGLGDRRASAARRYLQSLGVPPARLETLSKGSLDASRNADDATMARDRRVELVVVDPTRGTHAVF
jgi:peptidoglycan-associated lipoprotein